MPLYTWLRPYASDRDDNLKTKQRVAQKIKALRVALEEHSGAAKLRPGNRAQSTTTWGLRWRAGSKCAAELAAWQAIGLETTLGCQA
ncbi:hypothetical protein IQ254_19420 [Nodosilinea sp. LEGE 07088]|uniref:hypothetical protein n=1 Tax=Nodosilinea sp. LEGE 07088 TaxID=2777968 RepID=UPI00187E01A9|nr:hypothetical protein [Nodosilinea sp. LEGE 07088]MBE9139341.1 hypothetical protein [Nodosilinea sp. LEGE 07088]